MTTFDVWSGLGQAVTRGLRTYLDLEERQRQREEAERARALQFALSLMGMPDEQREAAKSLIQSIYPNIRFVTPFPSRPRPLDEMSTEEVLKDRPDVLSQVPESLRKLPWGQVRQQIPHIVRLAFGEDPDVARRRDLEDFKLKLDLHLRLNPGQPLPPDLTQQAKRLGIPIRTKRVVQDGQEVEVGELPVEEDIKVQLPGGGTYTIPRGLSPQAQAKLLDLIFQVNQKVLVEVNIGGQKKLIPVSADEAFKYAQKEASNILIRVPVDEKGTQFQWVSVDPATYKVIHGNWTRLKEAGIKAEAQVTVEGLRQEGLERREQIRSQTAIKTTVLRGQFQKEVAVLNNQTRLAVASIMARGTGQKADTTRANQLYRFQLNELQRLNKSRDALVHRNRILTGEISSMLGLIQRDPKLLEDNKIRTDLASKLSEWAATNQRLSELTGGQWSPPSLLSEEDKGTIEYVMTNPRTITTQVRWGPWGAFTRTVTKQGPPLSAKEAAAEVRKYYYELTGDMNLANLMYQMALKYAQDVEARLKRQPGQQPTPKPTPAPTPKRTPPPRRSR